MNFRRGQMQVITNEKVASAKDIVTGRDEAANRHELLGRWRPKTLLQLSSTTNVEASKMFLGETINASFDERPEDIDETLKGMSGLSTSPFSIRNEMPRIGGRQITVKELQSKSTEVMNVLMRGRLYVTQNATGRSAKITLNKNKLYVYTLRDEEPPPQACIIQHDDVKSLVDPSSRTAFLDIGTNESRLGTILISLSPDTKRANNFFLLSSAELGPSYLNTKLLYVVLKGESKECVAFGDYEYNTGAGGKGVVEGVGEEEGGVLERALLAGTVSGGAQHYSDRHAALFHINTRDNPELTYHRVFGQVESGLNILREAIENYPNIQDVCIIDCGIVVDF